MFEYSALFKGIQYNVFWLLIFSSRNFLFFFGFGILCYSSSQLLAFLSGYFVLFLLKRGRGKKDLVSIFRKDIFKFPETFYISGKFFYCIYFYGNSILFSGKLFLLSGFFLIIISGNFILPSVNFYIIYIATYI